MMRNSARRCWNAKSLLRAANSNVNFLRWYGAYCLSLRCQHRRIHAADIIRVITATLRSSSSWTINWVMGNVRPDTKIMSLVVFTPHKMEILVHLCSR
jgi:hypothetical protein